MKLKLKGIEERKTCNCFFCGTNKSVKYIAVLKYMDEPIDICNKCALIYSDKLKDMTE